MVTLNLKSAILVTVATLMSTGIYTLTFASEGSSGRGGGDIECDNTIQELTFQDPKFSMKLWFQNKGPEKQNIDLSKTLNPSTASAYSPSGYESSMLALISSLEKSPDINCVRPQDKGYPVDVNDRTKICASSVDQNGVHMVCDRDLFMGLSGDNRIKQIHHELAIHVPGLEPDSGSLSTYNISRQLSRSIQVVSEYRLVVQSYSAISTDYNNVAKNPDGSVSEMDYFEAVKYCKSLDKHLPTAKDWAYYAQERGGALTNSDNIHHSLNDDGTIDNFGYDSANYKRLTTDVGLAYWTSSSDLEGHEYRQYFEALSGVFPFSILPDRNVANVTCVQ